MRTFGRSAVVLGIFLLAAAARFAPAAEFTHRNSNPVRQGPGNYYPLLYSLPVGIQIEVAREQEGWKLIQVKTDSIRNRLQKDGLLADEQWLPKNCLTAQLPATDYRQLKIEWNTTSASQAGIAAAVRGNAMKYGGATEQALDSLAVLTAPLFSAQDYQNFKFETLAALQSTVNREVLRNRFGTYFRPYPVDPGVEGVGLGLATRLAKTGLRPDKELLAYLNMLTTFLVELSGAYDVPFRTLVLQDTLARSWSLPGGYLFISQGLLNKCTDEAELAAVIARELVHLVAEHAFYQTPLGQVNKYAESAMDELEAEAQAFEKRVPVDMKQYAIESYNFAIKSKNPMIEIDADRGAVVLLALAGYDPQAVARIMKKSSDEEMEELDQQEDLTIFQPQRQRLAQLDHFVQEHFADWRGSRNLTRFQRSIKR